MRRLLVAGAAALITGGCATAAVAPMSLKALRAPAATRANPTFVQGQPAEIIVSQQFVLRSKHVGAEYLIQVAIPIPPPTTLEMLNTGVEVVDTTFPNRDAAVLYVLDGGSDFPTLVGNRGQQFVVGIQPMFSTWQELFDARMRDLSHERIDGEPSSGGGDRFEAFLKEELRPFVENQFPIDPNKSVLAGYSLGGMFALRVLAGDPKSFAGYVIGDPSSFDRTIGDRLRQSAPKASGQRVYVGVADLDRPGVRAPNDALMAILQGPDSRLVVKLQEFPDEDHGSAEPLAMIKGTTWIFAQPGPTN